MGRSIFFTVFLNVFLAINTANAGVPSRSKAQPKKDTTDYFKDVVTYPGTTPIAVKAKQAMLIDFNTGKILLEKNAHERMAPSSMTKMMTSYVLEEKILSGEISSETEFLVSKKAWMTQGSKMFVHVGNKVKVADLQRGITIQSGNDASIVAAEGVTGSEEAFAIEMTRIAKELGMNSTNFKNASGLHEEGHYSTAADLGKLGIATIKNHSKFYDLNKEKEFTYNGIKQGNRNPLLYDNLDCDGIKTGHTDAGGFGVTASCTDGAQRYVLVINGLPSVQARADEARSLMSWAKANFVGKTVIKKGDIIEQAAIVENGVKETVPLVAGRDAYLLVLRSQQNQIKVTRSIQPLMAPVKENARGGTVIASIDDSRVEVELLAKEPVEKLGWFKGMLKRFGII